MSSILNQIKWAQNPLQGLPQAYARGQQLKLQREQFEESKKKAKIHQKLVMDQEKRAEAKHQAVMAQQDQARKVRTYKHWDKALGEAEGAMQQDPSGSMANTIMEGYRKVAEENPQHFDPELTQQSAGMKIAPVGWEAPRGVEQAQNIFTPEQIPQFRQQLQQGIQSLGVATTPEQQQERQLGQLKVAEAGMGLEKSQAQLTKTQLANVNTLKEQERKRTLGSDMLMLQSIQRLKEVAAKQPELYDQAFRQEMERIQPQLQKLDPQSAQMMGDPNFSIPPDQLLQMEQTMKERYSTSSDPKQYRDWMLKTADRVFQKTQDPADQNPDVARMKPQLWEQAKQEALEETKKIRKAGASKTQITIDPEGKERFGLKGKPLNDAISMVQRYKQILPMYEKLLAADDHLFGWLSKGAAVAFDKIEPVAKAFGVKSVPGEDFATSRQKMLTRAVRVAAKVLYGDAGKQLSDAEREYHMAALGDPEKFGPTRYKAAISTVFELAKEHDRGFREQLRLGGVDVSDPQTGGPAPSVPAASAVSKESLQQQLGDLRQQFLKAKKAGDKKLQRKLAEQGAALRKRLVGP